MSGLIISPEINKKIQSDLFSLENKWLIGTLAPYMPIWLINSLHGNENDYIAVMRAEWAKEELQKNFISLVRMPIQNLEAEPYYVGSVWQVHQRGRVIAENEFRINIQKT